MNSPTNRIIPEGILAQLQQWLHAQCNGDWETFNGISLESTDFGGWKLEIDLADTALTSQAFQSMSEGRINSDGPWLHCEVKRNKFIGQSDWSQLAQLIQIFIDFTRSVPE